MTLKKSRPDGQHLPDVQCEGEFYGGQDTIRLTPKLYHLIRDYHIGSVQNMGKYPYH